MVEIVVKKTYLSDNSPVFNMVIIRDDQMVSIPMQDQLATDCAADEIAEILQDSSAENVERRNDF